MLIGGAVAANIAFVSLTTTGLNSIAVACEMTKEVFNDFPIPILPYTTHEFLDLLISYTKVER